MNPSGEIPDIVNPHSKKPLLKFAVLIIAASLLIIGGALFIRQNTQKTESPFTASDFESESLGPVAESAEAKPSTQRELMNQDIRLVFDSKKYPNVVKNADLALKELDGDKIYQYYLQTFKEMAKAYDQTKDSKQKQVMVELRNYSQGNPAYQESDWPLPI